MDSNGNLTFLDLVTVMSFAIGLQNMELNERQIKLKAEDRELLSKILDNQAQILKLLKEDNRQ